MDAIVEIKNDYRAPRYSARRKTTERPHPYRAVNHADVPPVLDKPPVVSRSTSGSRVSMAKSNGLMGLGLGARDTNREFKTPEELTRAITVVSQILARSLLNVRLGVKSRFPDPLPDLVIDAARMPLTPHATRVMRNNVISAYDVFLEEWGAPLGIDFFDDSYYLPEGYLTRDILAAALYCWRHNADPTERMCRLLGAPELSLIKAPNRKRPRLAGGASKRPKK